MSLITFYTMLFITLAIYFVFAVLYVNKRRIRINMDYKLALRNLYQMAGIVLMCTFLLIYTISSVLVFISTWAIDKIDGVDSDYTIDLELFSRKMRLITKAKE